MRTLQLGMRTAARTAFAGGGYIGGTAPTSAAPDAPDGRARMLNVPASIRIVVYERSMRPLAQVYSAPDGTWRVDNLDPERDYVVIGFDGRGLVNAAIQDWVKPFVPAP